VWGTGARKGTGAECAGPLRRAGNMGPWARRTRRSAPGYGRRWRWRSSSSWAAGCSSSYPLGSPGGCGPIGPFNARFLGAVYLAELVGGAVLVVVARHFPARVVIPAAWTFTAVVTLASFVQLPDFDLDRRGPRAWFVAYVGFTLLLPFFFDGLRRGPQPPPTSPAWRRWFQGEGVVLCAYGAGLLVAPEPLTGFWPWGIDAFHGRIYSAAFLTVGVGSLLLAARSAPIELRALGSSRLVLGVLSVLGLVLADARVGTVDWGAPGTLVWTAAFAGMAVVGALMLRPAARPAPRH
jgi:hypothetical protein